MHLKMMHSEKNHLGKLKLVILQFEVVEKKTLFKSNKLPHCLEVTITLRIMSFHVLLLLHDINYITNNVTFEAITIIIY